MPGCQAQVEKIRRYRQRQEESKGKVSPVSNWSSKGR